MAIIIISWVFFRSPDIHFALRYILRLAGDTRGLSPLVFQVTNPLPIIDPSVILAFILGIVFCIPFGEWIEQMVHRLVMKDSVMRFPLQIIYDVTLFLLFATSVAALVSSSFAPGIYGKF
jgi:hypothetical protein